MAHLTFKDLVREDFGDLQVLDGQDEAQAQGGHHLRVGIG